MVRTFFGSRLSGVALIVFLLGCWEVAVQTGFAKSLSFPAVSEIFRSWGNLIASGVILEQLGASLYRMFIGYAIAAVLGISVGLLMGYFRWIDNFLEPVVELLRPIPTPAYIPVAILLLGLGTEMKVFLIATATFFPVLLNTYSGVKQVDPVQIDTGRTFGLNSYDIVKRIVLPSAIPHVFTGLRISLGIGLIMVVISEMVAANSGIGYFILQAQRSFEVAQMYAGIFTLGVVGYLLNFSFTRMERKIVHWR
ncbi:MAG: NitT/TauT family transport system permease protein [Burkholderiales bacterium]|jgi:ABC-type nitrate/sulfonate/bicarbonate transport system permease component